MRTDALTTAIYKFTGKERDVESGNDNFEARYYGSNLGRFSKRHATAVLTNCSWLCGATFSELGG